MNDISQNPEKLRRLVLERGARIEKLEDALEYAVEQVPELGTVPGIAEALAQHSEPGRGECGWSLNDEGFYQTDCGTEFVPPECMSLEELPSIKYCANCGRRIRDDGAPEPEGEDG